MSVRYAVKTYGTNEAIKIVRRNVPILTIINSCKFCDRLSTILNLPKTALATEPFLNVEAIRIDASTFIGEWFGGDRLKGGN